jgi:hypothetical protein
MDIELLFIPVGEVSLWHLLDQTVSKEPKSPATYQFFQLASRTGGEEAILEQVITILINARGAIRPRKFDMQEAV